jgi:hemerythrin superfamily protein
MSTDAIVVLKDDHRVMRQLFRDFKAAGKKATATKGKLVKKIIEELTVHTFLENEFMYPEVRVLMPALEDDILESYEEHHVVDVLCMDLYTMKPDAERFDAKMAVLMESVTDHMKEEEEDWFPKVRKGLTRETIQDLGARMLEAKKTAPRKPTDPAAKKSAKIAATA